MSDEINFAFYLSISFSVSFLPLHTFSLNTPSPTQGISSICSSSTIIPRPIAKRQHSSPAGYGIAHINLSDAVARIANGPRSCTNPFLNGSLSISEDTNSNATTIHEFEKELNDNSTRYTVEQERALTTRAPPNPFSRRIDENSIFSFPACATNGNANDDIIMVHDDAVVDGTGTGTATNAADNCALIQLDCVNDEYSHSSMTANAMENNCSDDGAFQQQFRNRSMSDTQTFGMDACNATGDIKETPDSEEQLETNPFVGGSIHKTVSDTQVEKLATTRPRGASQTWSFGRSLSRQTGPNMSGITCFKAPVGASDATDAPELKDLKRAMSCESVSSESSVILADLEQQIVPAVTGLLCVGLQYDK